MDDDLPIMSFEDRAVLRRWLEANHAHATGILVRIYKKHSGTASVSFTDIGAGFVRHRVADCSIDNA